MSNELLKSILWYTCASFIGFLVLGILTYFSPHFLPKDDPSALYRKLILSVPAILGIMLMGGALVFIDIVTPKHYMEKINEDPTACAILMAAVCIGVSLIICYA